MKSESSEMRAKAPSLSESVVSKDSLSDADQSLHDEMEREAMRLTINELEAVVEPLQYIARLTNQYLGGGCCDEHHRDNRKRLYEALSKFEDDSFTTLKQNNLVVDSEDLVNEGQNSSYQSLGKARRSADAER